MRSYETLFIVRPDLDRKLQQLKNFLTCSRTGCENRSVEEWGIQAGLRDKQAEEGYYVIINFRLNRKRLRWNVYSELAVISSDIS